MYVITRPSSQYTISGCSRRACSQDMNGSIPVPRSQVSGPTSKVPWVPGSESHMQQNWPGLQASSGSVSVPLVPLSSSGHGSAAAPQALFPVLSSWHVHCLGVLSLCLALCHVMVTCLGDLSWCPVLAGVMSCCSGHPTERICTDQLKSTFASKRADLH